MTRLAIAIAFTAAVSMAVPAGQAPSAPPPARRYIAPRTDGAPVIDGRLNDAAWTRALWSDAFVDIEGSARPTPTFPTRVKMTWDDTFLYVGAELVEPHVWATITEHDAVIFLENDFEVFIDPDADRLNYYEFEINARGTFWDLMLPRPYREGGKAVDSWEIPGLKSAVFVDGSLNDSRDIDRSWSVELALPWAVLKEHSFQAAPPRDGDEWRMNFSRVEWTLERDGTGYRKVAGVKERNWVWSPQGVIDMHRPETWGYVRFTNGGPRP